MMKNGSEERRRAFSKGNRRVLSPRFPPLSLKAFADRKMMRKEPLPFHFSKPGDGRERNGFPSRPYRRRPLRKSWEAEGGGLGREEEAFLQKGSSSPPPVSLPSSPYPRTARYSASLRPSWAQTKRSSSESGDAAGADSAGRLPVLWNDESAAMGETAAR